MSENKAVFPVFCIILWVTHTFIQKIEPIWESMAENYKWIKAGAQVSKTDRTIVAEIPKEALYFFVNGTDINGIMYSSPMKRVLKEK